MKIEVACMPGDTVYADLRDNTKKKPTADDLTECFIQSMERDKGDDYFIYTAVRKKFDVCHLQEVDYRRFCDTEFGESIFTVQQFLDLLLKEVKNESRN